MQPNDMPGRPTMKRLPNGVWRVIDRARADAPPPAGPGRDAAQAPPEAGFQGSPSQAR